MFSSCFFKYFFSTYFLKNFFTTDYFVAQCEAQFEVFKLFNTGCSVPPQVVIKISFSLKETFEIFGCCFFGRFFVFFFRLVGFLYCKWRGAQCSLCVELSIFSITTLSDLWC